MSKRIRASVVCIHEGKLLVVKLKDPLTAAENWFVPGGKVENDETPVQAAIRETFEETGYRVDVDANSESVHNYPYVWNGVRYEVTTYLYRAVLVDPGLAPARVNDASYNLGCCWLDRHYWQQELAFNSDIFTALKPLLQ